MNLRRPIRSEPEPTTIESDLRKLVADLHSYEDSGTRQIIASAINLYISTLIRFRSNSTFTEHDIDRLLTIWETLLDVRQPAPVNEFAPQNREPTVEPA